MKSVIKASSYILVHAPDMIRHNGTTQTSEAILNPESEYLKNLEDSIRTYEEAMTYYPNQCYIGGITPDQLANIEQPWYNKKMEGAERFAKYGEIMPQDEFLLLMQIADVFDLVLLHEDFVNEVRPRFEKHPLVTEEMLSKLKPGVELAQIEKELETGHGEGLYNNQVLVGCVKAAHNIDVALTSHVLLENLAAKASGALAVMHLLNNAKTDGKEVKYIVECSEEACGDMNQRGGGNFAKAIAEMAGLTEVTGSDVRGFCAAPSHALVQAASLVQAGTFDNVVVVAGGSTAKLGMNGKDHVKKDLPILEDVIGGFATLISKNDGIHPEIDLGVLGRHTVSTGSSPQKVISSLTKDALEKEGYKLTDVSKYAPEMQNPEVTVPAGAGNVPEGNYKMIGALAAISGEIDRSEINDFIETHGMVGWAPTQGHIPSGAPYIGHGVDAIMAGEIENFMLIGKGSLFLGRMTNLFDGISFLVHANEGAEPQAAVSEEEIRSYIAEAMRDFAQSLLG